MLFESFIINPTIFWNSNWNFFLGIAILLFTLLSVVHALWETKSQAITQYKQELLVVKIVHFFTLTEYLCPLNKIQAVSISTTPFLYHRQLGHITFSLKTGEFTLKINLKYLSWSICENIKKSCAPKIKSYTLKK